MGAARDEAARKAMKTADENIGIESEEWNGAEGAKKKKSKNNESKNRCFPQNRTYLKFGRPLGKTLQTSLKMIVG